MGNGDEREVHIGAVGADNQADGVGQLGGQLPSGDATPSSSPAPSDASKRGPGRPRGAASSSKRASSSKPASKPASSAAGSENGTLGENLRLRVDAAPKAKNAAPKTAPAGGQLDAGDALQASALVVMLANTGACMVIGAEGAMNSTEIELIQPAVQRIMTRMSPAAAAKFGAWSDPILLATGLAIWGSRVFGVVQARNAHERAVAAQQAADAAASVQVQHTVNPEPVRGAEGPAAPGTNGHAPLPDYAAAGAAPLPPDLAGHIGGIGGFDGSN